MLSKIGDKPILTTYMPKIEAYSLDAIMKKCSRLAYPIIGLLAISGIPTVSAGPAAFATCMGICLAATLGGFVPMCIATCTPSLLAPTP